MATKKRAAASGDDDKKNKLLRELLEQAIESEDPDLIELAKKALAKKAGNKPVKGKRGRPAKGSRVKDKKARNGTAEFTGNEFNPDEYKDMFILDTQEIDKKIKFKVSQRREAAEDVEVKCSLCQRTEFIPASQATFLTDTRYYVCNKHSGGA